MKNFLFIFLFITNFCLAQPGDLRKNLNEDFSDADVIVIDSTSNLSRIELLRDKPALQLNLEHIKTFPKQFKAFTNTTYLTISFWRTGITDLSFLNQFPNLTTLEIWRYEGSVLSLMPLKLNNLTKIRVSYCGSLQDIEGIRNLDSLEDIRIDNCAMLLKFPKFGKHNAVKRLTLNHMSNGRYFDEDHPKNYPTKLTNIGYLNQLEELTLGSLVYLTEIPSYFPRNLQKLEINGWALHHWKGDKVTLKNIDNLKWYPNLKALELYNIYLEKFAGNFENMAFDELKLVNVHHLTDVSGAFNFKSAKNIRITDCMELKEISGQRCNIIEMLEIHDCPNIENIGFLFSCPEINNLVFDKANAVKLPNLAKMNIPNIAISDEANKINLFRKDNKWITE